MELVNHTPAQAELVVSESGDERMGLLVAKLTFEVSVNGQAELVTADPVPLFDVEQETDLGAIPSDVAVPFQPVLDVVLLGAAYAPGGRAIKEMQVSLRIGEHRHELQVWGDRVWVGTGMEASISEPVPFTRMPLTWCHAFGGRADVWIDPHTVVPIENVGNPSGKGADLWTLVKRMEKGWGAPTGFPRMDYTRELPNLEHPHFPVRSWADEPEPYCWGLTPPALPAYLLARDGDPRKSWQEQLAERLRARVPRTVGHHDWRLNIPEAATPIVLEGCTRDGAWSFRWPTLNVGFDYELGPRKGTRALDPFLLVLFPDQSRFTVSLRHAFKFSRDVSQDRSVRLRVE